MPAPGAPGIDLTGTSRGVRAVPPNPLCIAGLAPPWLSGAGLWRPPRSLPALSPRPTFLPALGAGEVSQALLRQSLMDGRRGSQPAPWERDGGRRCSCPRLLRGSVLARRRLPEGERISRPLFETPPPPHDATNSRVCRQSPDRDVQGRPFRPRHRKQHRSKGQEGRVVRTASDGSAGERKPPQHCPCQSHPGKGNPSRPHSGLAPGA